MSTKYFFESLDKSTSKGSLWNAPTMPLAGKVIKSGSLLKHSSNATSESGLIERYFILQGDFLMYKKSEGSQSVCSVMNIRYAKLTLPADQHDESIGRDPIDTNKLFSLRISTRGKFTLLLARSSIEYHDWIAAFTSVMMRNDIHQRFIVEKQIGIGFSAQVFKAQETSTGKWFAVKGFNKKVIQQSSSGIKALWNEIEILREVKGKSNLLNMYEVHETAHSVYLVTELLEGGDLDHFTKNKDKVTEKEIVSIMCGILKGLKNDIFIHRDIKPANIMLKKSSNITADDVVIVDYGLAVKQDDLNPVFERCGTPGFIAPEVIRYTDVYSKHMKCDVYSAGVIMHMLCTGAKLFNKTEYDSHAVLKKNMQSNIEFPNEIFEKFSSKTIKVLRSMLHTDPIQRISITQASILLASLLKMNDEKSILSVKNCYEKSLDITKKHTMEWPNLPKNIVFPNCSFKRYYKVKSIYGFSSKHKDNHLQINPLIPSKCINDFDGEYFTNHEAIPDAIEHACAYEISECMPDIENPTMASPDTNSKPKVKVYVIASMKCSCTCFEHSAIVDK